MSLLKFRTKTTATSTVLEAITAATTATVVVTPTWGTDGRVGLFQEPHPTVASHLSGARVLLTDELVNEFVVVAKGDYDDPLVIVVQTPRGLDPTEFAADLHRSVVGFAATRIVSQSGNGVAAHVVRHK